MKNNDTQNDIDNWRDEIDHIDDEILALLARRFSVVEKIGKCKKEKNVEPVDEKRKNELFSALIKKGETLKISPQFIKELYEIIHDYSVKVQKNQT
jgi:chorismate mutase